MSSDTTVTVAADPDDADLLPEDAEAAHLIAAILPRLLDDDPMVADSAAEEVVSFVWGGDVA